MMTMNFANSARFRCTHQVAPQVANRLVILRQDWVGGCRRVTEEEDVVDREVSK